MIIKSNNTLVMKFGGAAVSTPERFGNTAQIIGHRLKTSPRVVVVVSAMGNTTNELIDLAYKVNPKPPARELDMMVSVGERISIALLAMALAKEGIEAISFTGSQSGIITTPEHFDAKIKGVRPKRIVEQLERNCAVIVAGYQGVSEQGEITTLGRGGSDTTAVALAIALGASAVEFYKDVDGVFDKDPKTTPDAKILPYMTFKELLTLTETGARILHHRCVLLAEKNKMPLRVIPFEDYKNREKGSSIGFESEQVSSYEPLYEI